MLMLMLVLMLMLMLQMLFDLNKFRVAEFARTAFAEKFGLGRKFQALYYLLVLPNVYHTYSKN